MSESDVVAWYLMVYVSIILASLLVQIAVKRFHFDKYLPMAGATMILNIVISLIIKLSGGFNTASTSENILESDGDFNAHLLGLSTAMFYYILLPPIIFSSGYHLKRQIFSSNFGAILSLAIIGTCISIVIISVGLYFGVGYLTNGKISLSLMEIIAFAAMISSTDPVSTLSIYTERNVESNLFYLVFGESILNDAVALTVFSVSCRFIGQPFSNWHLIMYVISLFKLLIGSALVGYFIGICSGYLYKLLRLTNNWHDQLFAIGIFLIVIYTPFLLSESIGLSGIVGNLAGGIAARRYINKNVSKEISRKASFACELISHISETVCFAQLGLCVFMQSFQYFNVSLIAITIGLAFLARLPVYPILGLVNYYRYLFKSHSPRLQENQDPVIDRIISHVYSQIQENSIDISKEEGFIDDGPKDTSTDQEETNQSGENVNPTIPLKNMHLIYWAGLRGAVSYSCANIFPDLLGSRNVIVATTISIILFTVLVQGGLTDQLLTRLGIAQRNKERENLELSMAGLSAKSTGRFAYMDLFEKKFIYPCVIDSSTDHTDEVWSPNDRESSGGGSVCCTSPEAGIVTLHSPKSLESQSRKFTRDNV